MAPLRSAIISGMNFIFLSLSRPAGRDKLIFTQRPKRTAAIGGTLSGKTGRFCQIPPFVATRHLFLSLSPAVTFLPGAGRICPGRGKSFLSGGAGIEQSEMTERVSHPGAGTALFAPGQTAKVDFREAEPFQIVFPSKMEYNETMNILPRLRLRYGRNLI